MRGVSPKPSSRLSIPAQQQDTTFIGALFVAYKEAALNKDDGASLRAA